MPPRKTAAKKKMVVKVARKKVREEKEVSEDDESYHSEAEEPVRSPSPPPSSEDEATSRNQSTERVSEKKASEKAESSQKKAFEKEESSQSSQKPKRKRNFGIILTGEQEVEMGEWLRSHPMLYIRTMSSFKDAAKKKTLWKEKAEELDVESGEMLETWYKSIRTRISKMMKDKSGSGVIHRTDRDKFIQTNFGFLQGYIVRKEGRTAVQLKMKSAPAPELSGSEMDVEEVVEERSEEEDEAEAEADVPPLHRKVKKGGRGVVKGRSKRPIDDGSDDEEMTGMLQQLSQQQKTAAQIQGRIEGLLTRDQQSSASAWGTWMGTLAQQIDIRLHPTLYRQATEMMISFIEASSKLPPHVPGQALEITQQTTQQLPQQLPQQPPQDGQQLPQQGPQLPQDGQQSTFQPLVIQDVRYQHRQEAPTQWPQWNTPGPAAGQPEASRPSSTPNMSLGSFGNISGTIGNISGGTLTDMLLNNPTL